MREILFKAKRIDNGEWIAGDLIHEPFGTYIQSVVDGKRIKSKVIECTICQYTGLTDKNGNKIWENDIVEISKEDGYFRIEWADTEAKWIMYNKSDCYSVDFDNYWSSDTEVIGNIFDNQDLLK